ncbi:MAG: tRNA epoxyqueuosine(34) reductase QueG [bacterium]|nr:tRNA epoxyqueuosine(34) reductase QueG [bacterium]
MTDSLSKKIEQIAKEEFGFAQVGILPLEPTETFGEYANWLERDYHGEMDWMHSEGRKEKRENVKNIMPSAKTIVTLAYSYYTADIPEAVLNDPSRGIFAKYAWGRDYHKILKKKLLLLINRIEEVVGQDVDAKAYVDTGPILERALAKRAGLGFVGKNSMIINSALGSYFFLSEIILDLECEPLVQNNARGGCRACTKCIDTCPTKAIVEPFVIDARKCISYLTIENRSSIPEAIRPLMKNRIYGCDICQEVCPWNSTAKSKSHSSDWLEADIEKQAPLLTDLALLDEQAFLERFQGTPIMRVKRVGLLRNVAIALGNWGDDKAIPSLELLAADENGLIAEHARWAMDQIH